MKAGTEIKVKTERPAVSLSLMEMNKDSWVMFELPGFVSAASGTKQDSMDALRKATATLGQAGSPRGSGHTGYSDG